MTRRKLILISITSLILILGISSILYIRSDSFLNNFIKPRVVNAIREQINEKYAVNMGKLSGNIFTGIEVDNFKIEERNEKTSILSTDKIVLKYNIFALLKRKFVVQTLEISSPEVNIERNSDGTVNLTQVLKGTPQESNNSFSFAISEVRIDGGKITLTDTKQDIQFELPNIKLALKGASDGWDHTGELSFDQGNFSFNGEKLAIDQFDSLQKIEFSISSSGGDFSQSKLKFGNSVLTMQGNWENNEEWKVNIGLEYDAADISKFIHNLKLDGSGEFKLDLSGTNSTMNGKLIGSSESLTIKNYQGNRTRTPESDGQQINLTALEIKAGLNLEEDSQITLQTLSAQIADGKLSGSGKITFVNSINDNLIARLQNIVKQPITYDSKWNIADIQLHSLLKMFIEFPTGSPNIESGALAATAHIYGDSTGNFQVDNCKIELTSASLLATRESGESIPFSIEDSSVNCTISSNVESGSNINANGIIDGSNLEINGSLENIELKISRIDFGRYFDVFSTTPFKGIGNIDANIKSDGTATGYVDIPEAFFNPETVPIGRLAGNFRYIDGVMYVENAFLTKKGEKDEKNTSVSIEGNIKLEGEFPANLRISANPLILDTDYNTLFFGQEFPIEGTINGVLNTSGSLTHLDGEGKFNIHSGKAWNINLDPATLPLKIKDYSLSISNFEITTRGQKVLLNTHVSNIGDFNFSLKNEKNNPVQLSQLSLAAEIADFPLDGKMDVAILSHQIKPKNAEVNINLKFTDLTFEGNPLGDAYLEGVLVQQSQLNQEPDFFKWTGKAFENTSHIEGTISNAVDNPYLFVMKCEDMSITPILRIFHPALDAINGTANATVTVEGTIAELSTTEILDPSKLRVFPYDVDIVIDKTKLQYDKYHFTNIDPIRMQLEDDILNITDSSLTVRNVNTPFIQLNGTFDAKSEEIDIYTEQLQVLSLEKYATELRLPIKGRAQYGMKIHGTTSDPIVDLTWDVPKLNVKTDYGAIDISDAKGELTYQKETLFLKPFSMNIFDDPLEASGNIIFNPDDFNRSNLNFDLNAAHLNLSNFSNLIRNSLPVETIKQLQFDTYEQIDGHINLSLSVTGIVEEPIIELNSQTLHNSPIRLGVLKNPIILNKINAITAVRKQSVYIHDILADVKVGEGDFVFNGDILYPTQIGNDITYNVGVSVNRFEISEFVNIFIPQSPTLKGTLTGHATLEGTGNNLETITVTSKIDEINFQFYNYNISNFLPIDIKLDDNSISSLIPLQVNTPEIESTVNMNIDGTLTSPKILTKWNGTLKHTIKNGTYSPMQLQGNIDYAEKLINLNMQLTNNEDNISLSGAIPYDLTLTQIDMLERFTEAPVNVKLVGRELPLTFIPSFESLFAEAVGVVDIDLTLQGTTRKPALMGNVVLEAPKILLNGFNQPIKNVSMQLNAQKDMIAFNKFKFNIEDGICNLEHCELQLDGLTPKDFMLRNFTIHKVPLGTMLNQIVPQEIVSELDGSISATLETLSIPLNSLFENGESVPIPKVRDSFTFDDLTQHAKAGFAIDNINLGFTVLEQQFSFNNPVSIPIVLESGTFRVNGLKLENTIQKPSHLTTKPIVFSIFGSWNMQGNLSASMKLDNLTFSEISQLLPRNITDEYEIQGILSGAINIIGTYEEPEIIVKLEGNQISVNEVQVNEFGCEVHYDHNALQWTIPDHTTLLKLGNNRILCSGRIPYVLSFSELQAEQLPEEMEIKVDMHFEELEVLSRLQPNIQSAEGFGTINATITGTTKTPHLTGIGKFDQVNLEFEGTPISFNRTNLQFSFSESQLTFKASDGQLSRGEYSAEGDISMNWFSINYIDINMSLDECNFVEPGQYEAIVSTGTNDLHLYGRTTEPILTGDIIIEAGSYEQNWENIRDWFSGATVSDLDVAIKTSFLSELELDVGIEIPGNFHFHSSLGGPTDIEVECIGRLLGPIQEPIFKGEVFLLGGQVSFPTQTFEIVQPSSIYNRSETTFNPELDIKLQLPNAIRGVVFNDGSTADVLITATISGALDNAQPTFQAIPLNSSTTEVLTEADILTLLLPDNSFSRSLWGIIFTISSGLDPNERHIIADIPFNLFGRKMSMQIEADEKGEYGLDVQLLERRF